MAEELKLSVEADRNAIYIYDETGCYDSTCNPGGWGTPNIKTSDITESTVEIFPPESSSGILVDISDGLPNIDKIGIEILLSEIGISTLKNGVWTFIYRVKNFENEIHLECSISKFFDVENTCCVNSLMSTFDANNLCSERNSKAVEMEILLNGARWMACCGNLKGAQTISNHIELQCKCCK